MQKKENFFKRMLWSVLPVKKSEIVTVFFISIVFILIILQYSIVRVFKDAALMSFLPASTGNPINTVKVFFVIPSAALVGMLSFFLSKKTTTQNLFYIFITFFLIIFGSYGLVLVPNAKLLCMSDSTYGYLLSVLPFFLHSILAAIYKWVHVLFFICAELFGAFAVGLFWNILNKSFSNEGSKRIYPCLLIFVQIGVYGAGMFQEYLESVVTLATTASGIVDYSKFQMFSKFCILICVLILFFSYIMNRFFLKTKEEVVQVKKPKTSTKKAGFIEGIKALGSSKKVFAIAILTLCYAITINLIEVSWKSVVISFLKQKFPGIIGEELTFKYTLEMAKVQKIQALFSVFLGIISSIISRYFSWVVLALATPFVIFFGGIFFYITKIYGTTIINPILSLFGKTGDPLYIHWMLFVIGSVIVVWSRSTKYIFFDYAKETATRKLSSSEQVQVKAAEGTLSRCGKAGGSGVQMIINEVFNCPTSGSIFYIILMGIMSALCSVWFMATSIINRDIINIKEENKKE
jgi:AAA family ATP:ADP antiporter